MDGTQTEYQTIIKEGFFVADCVDFMRDMDEEIVDLTVTSPPYDNLRHYDGYSFDFENIAHQLYRITKTGGIVVWVVGDKINGGRTLTSFHQGIFFQEIGFQMHDVMIYQKRIHLSCEATLTPTAMSLCLSCQKESLTHSIRSKQKPQDTVQKCLFTTKVPMV